jgi:hypothetical protein
MNRSNRRRLRRETKNRPWQPVNGVLITWIDEGIEGDLLYKAQVLTKGRPGSALMSADPIEDGSNVPLNWLLSGGP